MRNGRKINEIHCEHLKMDILILIREITPVHLELINPKLLFRLFKIIVKTHSHSRIKSKELTAANRRIANTHSSDLRMKSP